ncbi:MAG: hypothetical protein RL701_1729 [Pseudomonadota bacterium]|jgi:HAMP domain-containing protein
MRTASLKRLRIGFIVLAAALLTPLFFLMRSVQARLESQRRLRHEIVAERIFDEMERELTGLLVREGERPSSAYETNATRVETWAPFVVGYFMYDRTGLRVIARDQLSQERAERVAQAVKQSGTLPADTMEERVPASPKRGERLDDLALDAPAAKKEAPPGKQQAPQPEAVLRQLNRAVEQRDEKKRKASVVMSPKRADKGGDDPLSGLD